MGIIKYYNFEEFELFVFDEFIINQAKEGVVIQPEHINIIDNTVRSHFRGKNMVYILNRVKSYSVNPLIYPETAKIPNLIAIALIPKTRLMKRNAEYEREFFNKPFEIFNNLRDAMQWAHELLAKLKEPLGSKIAKPK